MPVPLVQPRWLERLLNIPHYGSPRNVRVCMRLLARVLPTGQPATAIVPPPASALTPTQRPSGGRPLVEFLLDLIGRELCDFGHLLAFGGDHGGKARWRSAVAWQAIVDSSVSLLRRLLLADSWRPHLLEALAAAVDGAKDVLQLDPSDDPPPRVRAPLAP